jgi:hypothetical protein
MLSDEHGGTKGNIGGLAVEDGPSPQYSENQTPFEVAGTHRGRIRDEPLTAEAMLALVGSVQAKIRYV